MCTCGAAAVWRQVSIECVAQIRLDPFFLHVVRLQHGMVGEHMWVSMHAGLFKRLGAIKQCKQQAWLL
jgi:hypothetical protein